MLKNNETVVAVITARGGSKSIPRKNILPLGGKPLVAWPIDLAKSVERIDRVIVSTEDDEIAAIAQQYGAEVPFKRPAELAEDTTPTVPVLQHCVSHLEKEEGYRADVIALFYPTSPFLTAERVNAALDMLEETGHNSVVSVMEDRKHYWINNGHPQRLYPEDPLNRQQTKPLYKEDGAIYFNRYEAIMNKGRIVDEDSVALLVVEGDSAIDIDEPADFEKAKKYLKTLQKNL